jgi:hypothetical protein
MPVHGQSARRGRQWASPNTTLAAEPAEARLERAAEEHLLRESGQRRERGALENDALELRRWA